LPNHIYFQSKFRSGQNDLFAVLKCLSIVEPEVGYVQGMGYMVALLLMYVDREDAFNIMCNIINKKPYFMKYYYTPGMPALKKTFYVLLCLERKIMPKLFYHMVD